MLGSEKMFYLQHRQHADTALGLALMILVTALLPSVSQAALPASVVQKRGDFCFCFASGINGSPSSYTPAQLSWVSQFNVVVTADYLLPSEQVSALHAAGCKLFFYEWLSGFYDPNPWVNSSGGISPGYTNSSTEWYQSILNRYPLAPGEPDWLLMPLSASGQLIPDATNGGSFYYDPTAPDFTANRVQHLVSMANTYRYDGVFFDETHYSSVIPTSQAVFQTRHPQLLGESDNDYYDRLCEVYDAGVGQFLQQIQAAIPALEIFTNQGFRDQRNNTAVGTPLYTYYLPYADYDLTEGFMTLSGETSGLTPVSLCVDGEGVQSVYETYVRPWYDPDDQENSTAFICQVLVSDPIATYQYATKICHLNYGDWRYLHSGTVTSINGTSYPTWDPTPDKEAVYEGVAAALLMGQSSYYRQDDSNPPEDEVYFVDMGVPHTEGKNYVYNPNPDSSGTEIDSGGQVAWRLFDNGIAVVNDSDQDSAVTVDSSLIPAGVTGLWDVFNNQPVAGFMTTCTMHVPASHYFATNRTVTSGRVFAFMWGSGAPSTCALVSSQNPSPSGQSITFHVTVAPVAPATVSPTGTVTFLDGTTVLGTCILSNGVAALSTASLALGLHVITASYSGDSNFATASGILNQLVDSAGNSWTWGSNYKGQLGNHSTSDSPVPVQVSGLAAFVGIAGGQYHSLALGSDGSAWAWGYNDYGQLGDGGTTDSSVPVPVGGIDGVVSVAAGADHDLALKSDGTVWAWGYNGDGELGSGAWGTNASMPGQVKDPTGTSYLTGVAALAAGAYHNVALKSDGTVWAWGFNGYGELGNNSTANSTLPVQVMDPTGMSDLIGVAAVAAGADHSLALKSDGTVWAWGYNAYGQLGNNSTANSAIPVQVSGIANVISVVTGGYHSLALTSDGAVWAWGANFDGQLGDNSTTNSAVPVRVSGLTSVVAVVAGLEHSLALRSDGTAWAWGHNSNGQLGNNSLTDSPIPVQAAGLTGVAALAGGWWHSIAIGNAAPPGVLSSSRNPANLGQQITLTATFSPVVPGMGIPTGMPTGTVTFQDGTTALGTQIMSTGSATFSTANLSFGSHSLTASYSGDSSFPPATSAVLTQVITDWAPLSAVPARDGTTHLLWGDGTGRADLRILGPDGSTSSDVTFGPYKGWQALALSVAPDNTNHILWRYTAGTVSIWKIDEAGDIGSLSYSLYGPYAGWSPVGMTTAADHSDHVLWKSTDNTMSTWRIDPSGDMTYRIFGPYPGWTPIAIAAAPDPDLSDHVLWKYTDNTMSAWRIEPSGAMTYQIHGPYPGWAPASIGVDSNLTDHILWNYLDGTMSIWNLGSAGNLSYVRYGPYAPWSAATVNIGPADGDEYVLWTYPDGALSAWNISSPGLFTYSIQPPPRA